MCGSIVETSSEKSLNVESQALGSGKAGVGASVGVAKEVGVSAVFEANRAPAGAKVVA